MAQINYVSRNQLHCTANLKFGLMCIKSKTLLVFVNKLFISVQLIVFLDHVLLLAELALKFKIAVWRSDSMKRNFRGFTFKTRHKADCPTSLHITRAKGSLFWVYLRWYLYLGRDWCQLGNFSGVNFYGWLPEPVLNAKRVSTCIASLSTI